MESKIAKFYEKVIGAIESGTVTNKEQLGKYKLKAGKQIGIATLPSNPNILMHAKTPSEQMVQLLSIKPLRTLSGVAPVAIMTKPISCPHGTCIYCPGGPKSVFGSVPQSYTGHEPATMRAISNNYDSYKQTMNRICQYYAIGHNPEKLELIIMGGTFPSFPQEYQNEFIGEAFRAANDFSEMFFDMQGKFEAEKFSEFFTNKMGKTPDLAQNQKPYTLLDVQKEHLRNEKSHVRIVTLCIETKPDWSFEKEINSMLELGATRVEIGAQSIYNEVLKYTNRGHTIEDTIKVTQLLKDSALKVTYHIMPGQPQSNPQKDIEMFSELFENENYCPDALKIYPCMVMPGTALAKLYENKKFIPLTTEQAAEIIAQGFRYIPEYVRVHRVQRDIPTKYALTGIDKNNLRQIIEEKMKEHSIVQRDIRFRESGIKSQKGIFTDYSSVELIERRYKASGSEEVFISFEDTTNDIILGFCRLRKPNKPFRQEFTPTTACIRELHVFGSEVGIGKHNQSSSQHKGFGKKMVEHAEEIARTEFGYDKMLVISGVGARDYYSRKLGYQKSGIYMAKNLKN
ncbi:MAG TPA: tRNA uridine(34) 5-carboxymethylaminomethyl modification radical SAM/GNAT enzyme Elp3 [archaeon]|nr:tRNA uridine(34) 5-carboxymethylaminomethyl modification radical SAM/GNAT enzyme Elp3 [archaeon]